MTYLCVGSDPRDVVLSWDDHVANADFAAIVSARGASVGNDDIVEELSADPAFVAWAHGGAAAPGV